MSGCLFVSCFCGLCMLFPLLFFSFVFDGIFVLYFCVCYVEHFHFCAIAVLIYGSYCFCSLCCFAHAVLGTLHCFYFVYWYLCSFVAPQVNFILYSRGVSAQACLSAGRCRFHTMLNVCGNQAPSVICNIHVQSFMLTSCFIEAACGRTICFCIVIV